jgi:putative ABC transport system ATP-binding protein
MEWGGIAWIISLTQVVGALGLMLFYAWQLALAICVLIVPLLLIVWSMQAKLTVAFNTARTRVGEMLSEVSESVMGAAVVRAYGLDEHTDQKVKRAIDQRYRAEVMAHFRAATLWPLSSVFYALSLSTVVVLGAFYGPRWGMSFGQVTAFLFLADGSCTCSPDLRRSTGDAERDRGLVQDLGGQRHGDRDRRAGRRRRAAARGAVGPADDVHFSYREGPEVLHGISLSVPAGGHVAIVGETGCGKSTFVKVTSRLADPTDGTMLIDGVDLRRVAPDTRRSRIRMVPQDGFLFDTTVRENVRMGRPGASDRDVETAFEELGLGDWWRRCQGLETHVGERGEALSVGERQLVALVRAQLATRAADPRRGHLGGRPRHGAADHGGVCRLSAGRTAITIAHRLSTAEGADRVRLRRRPAREEGTTTSSPRAAGDMPRSTGRGSGTSGDGAA